MDFFMPSNSHSSPRSLQEDSQMTEETELNRAQLNERGVSASMSVAEEQPTSSRIEDISRKVQDLIEKVNDSRADDQKVMDSFQEKLVEKVKEMCQQMKGHMYLVYEENSNAMQVKLHELSEVLESCAKLNKELLEASQALSGLREGLAISQMSEH